MLYFCLPKNDKLFGYWDTVADRSVQDSSLHEHRGAVRHYRCLNLRLILRLLVRAGLAGLDLEQPAPTMFYVFRNIVFMCWSKKRRELCGDLRSLGATLLATLEKRDAEELSLLRAKHETGLLEMIEQVREKQFEEAKAAESRCKSPGARVSRYLHYQRLLGVENPEIPAVDEVIPEIARLATSANLRVEWHQADFP